VWCTTARPPTPRPSSWATTTTSYPWPYARRPSSLTARRTPRAHWWPQARSGRLWLRWDVAWHGCQQCQAGPCMFDWHGTALATWPCVCSRACLQWLVSSLQALPAQLCCRRLLLLSCVPPLLGWQSNPSHESAVHSITGQARQCLDPRELSSMSNVILLHSL